jgi:hypothetical protein
MATTNTPTQVGDLRKSRWHVFAIRGRDLVVYLYAEGPKQKALLSRVGKYKMGKSCLYFRQLADLDKAVLEKLVVGSIAEFKALYQ